MPIGVPRIIYCWGEEVPAQWTDIYNFIFRRRMVFLMQYLDDELCNQICGLLINIHMEDRSKELEKKEMEKSGLFKSVPSVKQNKVGDSFSPMENQGVESSIQKTQSNKAKPTFSQKLGKNRPQKFIEDLLISEQDLGIDENYSLERYTLQKMTLEWLNWNAQFFDYSEEPYLFYLADILSKDFSGERNKGNLLYSQQKGISSKTSLFYTQTKFDRNEGTQILNDQSLITPLTSSVFCSEQSDSTKEESNKFAQSVTKNGENCLEGTSSSIQPLDKKNHFLNLEFARLMMLFRKKTKKLRSSIKYKKLSAQFFDLNFQKLKHLDVYSPFRLLSEFVLFKQNNQGKFPLSILEPLLVHSSLSPFSEKIEKRQTERQSKKLKHNLLRKKLQTFQRAKKQLSEIFFKNSSLAEILTANVPFNSRQSINNDAQLISLSLGKNTFSTEKQKLANSSLAKRSEQCERSESILSGQSDQGTVSKIFSSEQLSGKSQISNLMTNLAQQNLFTELNQRETQLAFSKKTLSQKILRRNYKKTRPLFPLGQTDLQNNSSSEKNKQEWQKSSRITGLSQLEAKQNSTNFAQFRPKPASYLNQGNLSLEESYMEFRDYYRKQTENTLQDEESKKVFMIINSFGGSVGNGITVHDALQFIKAGSLTLALGVAASAASLALAGGTVGERYVTEGCHTMIHQPEGGLSGQASDIWIDSQEIMKIRLDVAEIYSLSTYRPRHKILRDLDRDFYLTASETIFYGLADEIATNEVLQDIISLTNQTWGFHDAQQQKLLERREGLTAGSDTQTQN